MAEPEYTTHRDHDGLWWVAAATIAVAALILAAVGLFLPASSSGSSGSVPAASPGGEAAGAGQSKTFDIEVGDLYVKPKSIEVAAGTAVVLNITNKGAMAHDMKLQGTKGTDLIPPGKSATADLGVISASTQAWCTVPGHKAAGMVLDIAVTGAAASGAHGEQAAATPTTAAAAGGSQDATIDPNAKPPAGWTPRDPVLAPAEPATVHKVTLEAREVLMEVAPGVTQLMWTFNGQTPGPMLRGKVGDKFEITLVNKGTLGHSIDFHASKVAWNDEMRTIQPGESLQYDYTADYAGIFMYHCGTAPTLHHIGNGMYGAIVIDPPNLPPVDKEFFMVQSELYLGPQGDVGDLTKMQNEQWDAVVFNGYHSQYKHSPIPVDVNKRYRVWVLDAGPNENSAFHIVGTIFDTVFKEGSYLLQPDASKGGSQALDLQPAQGGFVEFTFAEQGYYPFVTHKFANPGKGAIGLFAAGNPPPLASGAGH